MNEIWVPKGTEILTTEGWSKIEYVFNSGGELMTINLDKRKIERQLASGFKKKQSVGKVSEIRSEFSLIRFQTAALINKKEVFDGFDELPSIAHTFKQIAYNGILYSFQVPNKVAIFRNFFKGINITGQVDLDEGLFTQDEYEDAVGVSYLDYIDAEEALESRWSHTKYRPKKEITSGTPDYWISHTRWG